MTGVAQAVDPVCTGHPVPCLEGRGTKASGWRLARCSGTIAVMSKDYAIRLGRSCKGHPLWVVRFSRQGVCYTRTFSFGEKRTRQQARAAAEAWRDAQLRCVRPMTIIEFAALDRANNTSGVPGVSFYRPKRQPLGIWQARLILGDGTRMVKSFSVKRLGYESALAQAVAARRKMEEAASDRPFLRDALALRCAPLRTAVA